LASQGKKVITDSERNPHSKLKVFTNHVWPEPIGGDLSRYYKDAADKIVNEIAQEKDLGYQDYIFWPLVFLYRHSLELLLKDIVWYGVEVGISNRDSVEKKLFDHKLYQLWNLVKHVILQLRETLPDFMPNELINATESMVHELHNVDRNGECLRYLFNKENQKLNTHFPEIVDMKSLQYSFNGLHDFLSYFLSMVNDIYQSRNTEETL